MKHAITLKGFWRRLLAASLPLFLWTGCMSLAEQGGRIADGSAFAETTLAQYREPGPRARIRSTQPGISLSRIRERKGDEALIITGAFPNLRFKGSLPGPSGEFTLRSLSFLCPNLNGWNEFTLELVGTGTLIYTDAGAILRLNLPLEQTGIIQGKIRREQSRLTGEQALAALRNREERIAALTEWMASWAGTPDFGDQEAFEAFWKPILLPETMVPAKRPPEWNAAAPQFHRAEDVNWNEDYTQTRFPENLWGIRNSGTLLRDWEEAAAWIYFAYQWDRITGSLGRDINLIRIK